MNEELIFKVVEAAVSPLKNEIKLLTEIITNLRSEIRDRTIQKNDEDRRQQPQELLPNSTKINDNTRLSSQKLLDDSHTKAVSADSRENRRIRREQKTVLPTVTRTQKTSRLSMNGTQTGRKNERSTLNQQEKNDCKTSGQPMTERSAPTLTIKQISTQDMGENKNVRYSDVTARHETDTISQNSYTDTTSLKTDDKNYEWQTAQRRRPKSKVNTIVGKATGTKISSIEIHKFLHACFFKTSTTTEDIIKYLTQVWSKQNYLVEQIPSKRATYNSFKIGVPKAGYQDYLSCDKWPENIIVSPWQPFLQVKPKTPDT